MFGPFEKIDMTELKQPIDRVLRDMESYGPDSPEYPNLLTSLERLVQLRRGNAGNRVSPDTMATVMGNLLGILVIVAYEQKHVMSSKGLGFILKPK